MKAKRIFKGLGLLVAVVAACAAGLFLWWRGGGRPQREGSARIAQLEASVDVRFDAFGAPHVRAQNLRDAARAIGWLHANDRLGQMELMRRYVSGRLAEIVGPTAVGSDRRVRELRFPQTVDALLASLSTESRAVLDAYSEGVNAWLEERNGDLPPDLRLLRAHPEPWSARDSLSVQMMLSQMLSYSSSRELNRLEWLHAYGVERATVLIGSLATDVPAATIDELIDDFARYALPKKSSKPDGPSNGSNNWAVDASRSADGHALVANDPHLNLGLPSIWFQVQVRCPDYEAAGFTVPGLPLVLIGQGPHVAWGFTNTELDVCDTFLERVSEDGLSVERDGAWVPLRVQHERIEVRGEAALEFDALSTDIGPLLTWGQGLRYSLAWTAHQPGDTVRVFLDLARAPNVDSVPNLVRDFIGPPQNMICGDSSGAILYTLLGRNVERGRGDGRIPLPARERANHWRGLRPYEQAPHELRPASGLLTTANNDTRPADADYPYPVDAATSHRAQRIAEELEARKDWTPGGLGELQTDITSLYAKELVAALDAALDPSDAKSDADAARALDTLRAWSGAMTLKGASALYQLVEARVDQWLARAVGRSLSHPELARVRVAAVSGALDEPFATRDGDSERGIADRRAELALLLAAAWREGAAHWGDDVALWNYGELHSWKPRHGLDAAPVLGALFDVGEFAVPGSSTSPCVFTGSRRTVGGLPHIDVSHGASLRFVADCANPDASLAILTSGQAGHPFDAHYSDQLDGYLSGRLRPMHWSQAAIDAATMSTLTLAP